ncbi:hypothetical protein Phou_023430 [Phytohabitans houttuyneae]|uniref:RecG wedge domain-containing protein n=1 Tax=Phytohabitans houttuyneae TaxID=1076126 RepID=A0A6V8JZC4_9ACTN|nr:hypothetical protein Phou_023430 [Phytohabitans houttuyneae]
MTDVDTPLTKVLGANTAKALATHLDLHTAGDLLYHFPGGTTSVATTPTSARWRSARTSP